MRVSEHHPLTPAANTFVVHLQTVKSDDHIEDFAFAGYTSLSQLGRFYCVRFNKKHTRLYSQANFIQPRNKAVMSGLFPEVFKNMDQLVIVESETDAEVDTERSAQEDPKKEKPFLPLILKKYEGGKVSPALALGTTYSLDISEPRGFGLEIGAVKPGRIVLVTGGTGILPFVDLIDLAFKAALVEEKHPASTLLLSNDPVLRDKPFKNFKFTLLAAFPSVEEVHPLTLKQVAFLSKDKSRWSSVFHFTSRPEKIPETILLTDNRFEDLLREELEKPFSKVLVCGPPPMVSGVLGFFEEMALEKDSYCVL